MSTMLLIARTDAESGRLISSSVDVQDHPYMLGTTRMGKSLAEVLAHAEAQGKTGAEVDKVEKEWSESHQLCTFDQGQWIILVYN